MPDVEERIFRAGPSGPMFPLAHILWAEDEPADRQLITAALAQLPYPPQAEFVTTGEEMLAKLETETPGLLVVDLGMPGMGGLETIQRLRAGGKKRIPVVVFTGREGGSEADACYAAGARDVVQKPTDFNSFLSAVQRIVRHTAW